MKKLLSALLMGAMLSTSLPAFAEEGPEVPAVVVPMTKGQPAPYSGVLLTPAAAATITVELNSIAEKVKIAVDRNSEEASARCEARVSEVTIKAEADRKVLQAQLDAQLQENKVITDRLAQEEKNRPNIMLWTGAGVLGGIATTVLIVVLTK